MIDWGEKVQWRRHEFKFFNKNVALRSSKESVDSFLFFRKDHIQVKMPRHSQPQR